MEEPPEEINLDLDEVLDLLAQQVERLKLALEYYRQSDLPDRQARIIWHVKQIDARQDRMEELKALILHQKTRQEH